MGFFERESLPRRAKQIDQAGKNEQDNNIKAGDIDRKNTQKHFCLEEAASFSCRGVWRSQ